MMTAAASSSLKENRKSSIDTEPRTLSLAEIHNAREAAIDVLNTKTWEEAINIFTEGLKSVEICKPYESLDQEEEEEMLCGIEHGYRLNQLPSYNDKMMLKRDMVTAPF